MGNIDDLNTLILGNSNVNNTQQYYESRGDIKSLVEELERLDKYIAARIVMQEAKENQLDLIETSGDGDVEILTVSEHQSWYNKFGARTINYINGWIDHAINNKWESSTKNDEIRLINSAVWQFYQELKKNNSLLGITTKWQYRIGNLHVGSYEDLMALLGKTSILNVLSVPFNYDGKELVKIPSNWGRNSIQIEWAKRISNVNGLVSRINGWIQYIIDKNWEQAKINNINGIFTSAAWQIWLQLQKEDINGLTNNPSNIDGLYVPSYGNLLDLLNKGIFQHRNISLKYRKKISYNYTLLDSLHFNLEKENAYIEAQEKLYIETYNKADSLRSSLKIESINALNRYDRREDRKKRREERRAKRSARRSARREVGKLIWRLDNRLNPKRMELREELIKLEIKLDFLSKKNEIDDQAEFDKLILIHEQLEKDIEQLDEIEILPREERLAELANTYNFADRKSRRYEARTARRTFRNERRVARKAFKETYGKGWRKEVDWQNYRLDLRMAMVDRMEKNPTLTRKIVNNIKTGAYVVPRASFLALCAVNAFGMTSRIAEYKEKDVNSYNRVLFRWKQFGGNRSELDKILQNNKNKRPLPAFGTKISDKFFSATGVEEISAAIAGAAPIITSVATILTGITGILSLVGDKDTADNIKDMALAKELDLVDRTDGLTNEEKDYAKTLIRAGSTYIEAMAAMGIEFASPNDPDTEKYQFLSSPTSIIIGGSLALLGLGLILYFSLRKK